MSAAKEREAFYDAALACPDTASVNQTILTTTGTMWAGVAGRSIKLKRISLAIKLNTSFNADDEFTFVLRDSPTTIIVPLVGVPIDAAAGDVFVENIDLKEGVIFPVGESVLIAVQGATVGAGTFSVEGVVMGEII